MSCCMMGLLVFLSGCGGSSDNVYGVGKTVPVSGKVTFEKKIPANATVGIAFHPEEKGSGANLPSSGSVNEQGSYTLGTGSKEGAPVGKYKVVITATVPENPKDQYSPNKSVIDPKYSSAGTTPLSAQVAEGAAAGTYDFTVK